MDSNHDFFDWLWRLGAPVQISGAATMRALPDSFQEVKIQFEKLRASICIPLMTKTGLLGIMILGNKEGKDYSQEDLEILESLAIHSSLAIQNAKLQEHLRESKELESFYKLSSFVVHDLRNALSILSMLSENAKVNMDNLEFRNNLIKTLEDSVDKIKDMLSKISMSSKTSQFSLKKTDINALIKRTIEDLKINSKYELKLEFSNVPNILADKEQLKKIVTNLILNAIEAMPDGGKLSIQTSLEKLNASSQVRFNKCQFKEFVEITVSDNGQGMTKDFQDTKLFKPFQTTKKKGLGIGLYHCKEIIESIGGQIWVNSKLGMGSAFHIALPIKNIDVNLNEIQQEKTSIQLHL